MRTTIVLDDDIEAAVTKMQRERGIGQSEAINELARIGISRSEPSTPYVHRSAQIGLRVDVSNIGEVLELLDEAPYPPTIELTC